MTSASTSGRFAADLAFRARIQKEADRLWPEAAPMRVFHSRAPGAHYALRLPEGAQSLPSVPGMTASAEGGFVNFTLSEDTLREGLSLQTQSAGEVRDDAFTRRLRALLHLRADEPLWGAEAAQLAWTLIDPYTKKERILRDFEAWFRTGHVRFDMLRAALTVWAQTEAEEEE